MTSVSCCARGVFQFTHPGRGATGKLGSLLRSSTVSIHAPREGCDVVSRRSSRKISSFNSRTPGGVRQLILHSVLYKAEVSIHAPREGCDTASCLTSKGSTEFQFTHPGRGATHTEGSSRPTSRCFNSRTPGGVRLGALPFHLPYFLFQFTHPGRGATKSKRPISG